MPKANRIIGNLHEETNLFSDLFLPQLTVTQHSQTSRVFCVWRLGCMREALGSQCLRYMQNQGLEFALQFRISHRISSMEAGMYMDFSNLCMLYLRCWHQKMCSQSLQTVFVFYCLHSEHCLQMLECCHMHWTDMHCET